MTEGGKACRKLVNPIVGECDKCKIPFCMTHRLYEDHQCRELPTVSLPQYPPPPARLLEFLTADVRAPLPQTKMELYQANAEQLLKEQTQVVKI